MDRAEGSERESVDSDGDFTEDPDSDTNATSAAGQADNADASAADDELWLDVSEGDQRSVTRQGAIGESESVSPPALRPDSTDRAVPVDEGEQSAQQVALETGIEGLDNRLDGGFVPGSIIAIEGDPRSKSKTLLTNLIAAQRPVYYFAGAAAEPSIEARIDRLKLIPQQDRFIFDTAGWAVEDLIEELSVLDIGTPSTIVVDPITIFEQDAERQTYVRLVRTLRDTIGETSIALIHCLSPDTEPANRWVSLNLADTVLEVRHDPGRTSPNILFINRLHPDQEFTADNREYDIVGDRDLAIQFDESITTPTR